MALFTIRFVNQNEKPRTVKADQYQEVPDGFITFTSKNGEQVLTIKKVAIDEIERDGGNA
jgi:hypothetical protein